MPSRRPAQVEANEGDALFDGRKNERPRLERIQNAHARRIMPCAVTPHGVTDWGRDLHCGGAGAKHIGGGTETSERKKEPEGNNAAAAVHESASLLPLA